jgi:large subunit ribosomal protein L2
MKHRKIAEIKHYPLRDYGEKGFVSGKIMDFVHEISRMVPLALVEYETGEKMYTLPAEGVFIGDTVQIGKNCEKIVGNTLALNDIPEGTLIFNIELRPGDGGKLVRASGGFATVMTRMENGIQIELPSRQRVVFNPECRATIGVVPGGGKTNKPFMKAGTKHFYAYTRTMDWPYVKGCKMIAQTHPYGGGRKRRAGGPTSAGRNWPPGKKVGKIAGRRTGRKKR